MVRSSLDSLERSESPNMSNLDHQSPSYCAQMGHLYTSVLVIRCPHLEGYSVRVRTFQDTDGGDTVIWFERETEFGPFDELGYIASAIGADVAAAIEVLRQIHL